MIICENRPGTEEDSRFPFGVLIRTNVEPVPHIPLPPGLGNQRVLSKIRRWPIVIFFLIAGVGPYGARETYTVREGCADCTRCGVLGVNEMTFGFHHRFSPSGHGPVLILMFSSVLVLGPSLISRKGFGGQVRLISWNFPFPSADGIIATFVCVCVCCVYSVDVWCT